MSDEPYMLWLSRVKGMTARRAGALLRRFGTAEAVFRAAERELRAYANVPEALVSAIVESRKADTPGRLLEELARHGCTFVSIDHPEYPPPLKAIDDAPLGLYVKGALPPADAPAVAIIGSRRCSEYGLAVAEEMARGLAARGVVIVSGLARGIDGEAHKGAIAGGGKTVAVMGNGLDICYPPEHTRLADDVARHGCLVSEYPFGTPPDKYTFPNRNRIVSGLCAAVLVVESEERSGTSITVARALEQGRVVMAVPGSIYNRFSKGTNYLIYLGATPIFSVEDALFELRREVAQCAPLKAAEAEQPPPEQLGFDETENMVYACMGVESVTLEDVLHKTGLSVQKLRQTLLEMELGGFIDRLPGERYRRARK